MDLLDPIAMRMYPVLEYAYGEELVMTTAALEEETLSQRMNRQNIYDDTFWGA